jgi:hypothetical protein
MRKQMSIGHDPNETAAWIGLLGTVATACGVYFGGKAYRQKQVNLARITNAEATAKEAIAQTAQLGVDMAECKLDITKSHATNDFVQEVELRITRRVEVLHKDIMDALKG